MGVLRAKDEPMPEKFDESWEYYVPDPEIEELLGDMPDISLQRRWMESLRSGGWTIIPNTPSSITINLCKRMLSDYQITKAEIARRLDVSTTTVHVATKGVSTKSSKKADLVILWNDGMTVFDIAVKLNIHIQTVTVWRKELNLPSRKKVTPCL